ncbi:type-2 restriction enzyme DpnII [archaeon]|nr:type-2 restriction enzyme DpnII [archaeon]
MVDMEVYWDTLKIKDSGRLIDEFIKTIVDTNRSYSFFVDWKKVISNAAKYRIEINILNSLLGSGDLKRDIKALLEKYPEVTQVIPILIAVRDLRLKIIEDFSATDVNIVQFDFTPQGKLSEGEIEKIINFCEKCGIFYLFADKHIKNLEDYIFGVEVGMDTNARKNRSGKAMEILLEPEIQRLKEKYSFDIIAQKQFKTIVKRYSNIKIPPELKDRKFDFVFIKGNKAINIEVNYYAGGGSKPQEIVDSYINRKNELKDYGWEFIWVTDGDGWLTGKNQMHKAFEKQEYGLNINFIRKGMLEPIIKKIFEKA